MRAERASVIRENARQQLVGLWRERTQIWETTPDPEELVRRAPEIIVTEMLGLRLEKPEEIPSGVLGVPADAANDITRREVHRIDLAVVCGVH